MGSGLHSISFNSSIKSMKNKKVIEKFEFHQ